MFWTAVLLGLVEGVTEFLPISSTGHLILAEAWIGFHGPSAEVFTIVIQLGAVLSIVWEYRARFVTVAAGLPAAADSRNFILKLGVAFVPSAAVGLLIHDFLFDKLFAVVPVAAALIGGGVLILIVEALPLQHETHDVDAVGWKQALGVGVAQCLALWPGFSRSAATILGGLLAGLDRRTATEFSFFLAVPTIFAAAGYELLTSLDGLDGADWGWLALSFAISFLVAWASVRWLLRYVSTHSFGIFAWYRIGLGLVILFVVDRLA